MELHYIRKHASLSVLFGQHSGTGLLALHHARHITDSRDSKEIQEIQRIKKQYIKYIPEKNGTDTGICKAKALL